MEQYKKDFLTKVCSPPNKKDSFSISVKRYYTNVDGFMLDKSAVPLALQTKYPVYLFSGYDRDGGFKISANETPPLPAYTFVRMFVKNDAYDFTQFSGLNDIQGKIFTGDLVFLYTDDINNPNIFIWIVQSVTNRALGSILSNLPDKGIHCKSFTIFTDNERTFNESIGVVKPTTLGLYKFDKISPLAFKQTFYRQEKQIVIPYEIMITNLVGFTSYIPFVTDRIEYDFKFINVK